jgi:hypothetical protein
LADLKKTIELNGKLYDAATGQVIETARSISKPSPGAVMDGFVPSRPSKTPQSHIQRKPEPSKTLMRPAVKKPELASKNNISVSAKLLAKPTQGRTHRAKRISKSPLIRHFTHPAHTSNVSKVNRPLPVTHPTHDLSDKVAGLAQKAGTQISHSTQLVEKAIASSSSHLMRFEKDLMEKKSFWQRVGWKNKAANFSSLAAAFVLLVGFFAWQNTAQIEMRVAATRAGVSAHLPGYSPAGFGVTGPIQTEPGKVTVSFKSHTDERQFKVTKEASNWNSDSLLNNYFISSNRPTPISYPSDGKTIYIYDDTNATWVNAGVWYNIEGDSNLTTDQLLRLASSL